MEKHLPMWVIYENPVEAPGQFVVRRWAVPAGGGDPVADDGHTEPTLYLARRHVPAGSVRMEPSLDDDPAICEVWI